MVDAFALPHHERLTKGKAKSTFALNDADLKDLACIKKPNRKYPFYPPMLLYSILDLKALCLLKYGSLAGLASKLAKNESARIKRNASRAKNAPKVVASAGGDSISGKDSDTSDDSLCEDEVDEDEPNDAYDGFEGFKEWMRKGGARRK